MHALEELDYLGGALCSTWLLCCVYTARSVLTIAIFRCDQVIASTACLCLYVFFVSMTEHAGRRTHAGCSGPCMGGPLGRGAAYHEGGGGVAGRQRGSAGAGVQGRASAAWPAEHVQQLATRGRGCNHCRAPRHRRPLRHGSAALKRSLCNSKQSAAAQLSLGGCRHWPSLHAEASWGQTVLLVFLTLLLQPARALCTWKSVHAVQAPTWIGWKS